MKTIESTERRVTLEAGKYGEGFAFLAATLWGINYMVVKIVLATVPEPLFLLIRFGATVAILLSYLAWRGETFRVAPEHVLPVVLLGLFGVGMQNITWTYGIHRTTVSSAALLICSAPLFTLLYAVAAGRERSGWFRMVGTGAAFSGIYVLVAATPESRFDFSSAAFIGNLLILASAVLFAYYSLASQPLLRHYSAVKLFALASVVALPILAANAAVAPFEVSASSLGGRTAAEFAYIVIFGTVVAFVCWFKGINRTSPVRTTVYQFMTPLVSTLLGAVVLGEHVGGGHAAGAMLICGGLLAARYDPAGAPQAKAKNKRAGRETCRKGEYCQR